MLPNLEIPVYTLASLLKRNTSPGDFAFISLEELAGYASILIEPHRYNFYIVMLVTGGGGRHAIDLQEYALEAKKLILIAPGQVHSWTEWQQTKGFAIFFTDNLMTVSSSRKRMPSWPVFHAGQPSMFALTQEEMNKIVDVFHLVEHEIGARDEFTRDAVFYAISSLLVHAARLSRNRQSKRFSVSQDFLYSFQELIERNFLVDKTPKEYADKLNITPNYLNALCRKKSGKSAGELIRQRILLEAKRLLAHTDLSASEIAFRLGFEDNSYFGRYFRKYTHLTPGAFRRQHHA